MIKKKYRKKVGEVDFDCVNCGRHLHRVLWAEATEFYADTGKPTPDGYDLITAFAYCSCGAQLLVADDYEKLGLYWVNEEKMKCKSK